MTSHLSRRQLVDALERPLSLDQQVHVDRCAACAGELAAMRALVADVVAAGEVPEPSPLFWDRLSARVREAVDAEPVSASGWAGYWRPLAALAGVLAVLILAAVLRPSPTPSPAARPAAASANASAASDVTTSEGSEAMWDMIGTMATSIGVDDARDAGLVPGRAATDAAIESLTQAQRRELVKLLRAELGASD